MSIAKFYMTDEGAEKEMKARFQNVPIKPYRYIVFTDTVVDKAGIAGLKMAQVNELYRADLQEDSASLVIHDPRSAEFQVHVPVLDRGITVKGAALLLEDGTLHSYARYAPEDGGFYKAAQVAFNFHFLQQFPDPEEGGKALEVTYIPLSTSKLVDTVVSESMTMIPRATQEKDGLMTNDDKRKLDSLLPAPRSSTVKIPAVAASTLFSSDHWQPEDMGAADQILKDGSSGVLLQPNDNATVNAVLPYLVVIGDSISEGHPALHGEKHLGDQLHEQGQISYHLADEFNIPVLNHGIGGQETFQIRARWQSDVIDALGNGVKPYAVYLHCGVNDVFRRSNIDGIKENFEFFAQSCLENGIKLIVANVGADSVYTTDSLANAKALNDWLVSEFLPNNTNVVLVDYLEWSTDGTRNYKHLKAGMFTDTVHPTKDGYADYAQFIIQTINSASFPLYLSEMQIKQNGTIPSSFGISTCISLDGNEYEGLGLDSIVTLSHDIQRRPNITLELSKFEAVKSTVEYVGLSGLSVELSSHRTNKAASQASEKVGSLAGAAVVFEGNIAKSWKSFGLTIDDSNLETGGYLTAVFEKDVHFLDVQIVGKSSLLGRNVRWSSGNASQGLKRWWIYIKDDNGIPVNQKELIDIQVMGWSA